MTRSGRGGRLVAMDHDHWRGGHSSPDRLQAERAKVLRLRAEGTAESRAIGAAPWQARAELSPHQKAVP